MKNKLIGLYQLITGVFGVILLAFNISDVIENNDLLFPFVFGLLLFAGLAYAGYALLNNLQNAVKYSIWAQALQIVSFTYGTAKYLFTGSAFLSLVIGDKIGINTQIQPIDFAISGHASPAPFEMTFFILPILLVVLLSRK